MRKHIALLLVIFCMAMTTSFAVAEKAETYISEPPEIKQILDVAEEDCIISLLPVSLEELTFEDYITPEEPVELRYGFTSEERYLLAQLLCGDGAKDGDGEYDIDYQPEDAINYHEVSKVLCVVMNRVRDDRFPNTVTDVVLARNQFHVFPKNLSAVPSERAVRVITEWCTAYDTYDGGAQVIPENHIYFYGNGQINITRAG